jgi:hypothetical protein
MTTIAETKKPKAENPWLSHVKAFKNQHNGMSYKEALSKAGETYKKVVREEKTGERKPNPWMQHIEKWKLAHPDWKTTHSYKDVLKICKTDYKPSVVN